MTEIINQFEKIPTTCISDALQGLTNMDVSIKPLKEDYRMAGRAFTVKVPVGDNLLVLKAMKEAKPGDVLVIDIHGDTTRAIAGDFVLGMAQTLGITGVVTNGVIRDIQGIKALNFPVFCQGTTLAAGGKAGFGDMNIPISLGGTTVNPGDIIVGDADGVVVVQQHIEEEILTKSLEKLQRDETREKNISENIEAIHKYIDDMLSK
ncbi:RraA family protein [Anaerobacillus sp. MEB173]|uniref:RraA family protein n=1 Tax=Anaerobacillus sp. MEB173 TaxID=3383345 RepID=UPI003F8E10FF